MIDWLTLWLDREDLSQADADKLAPSGYMQKINGKTGEIEYTVPCRESIRSDSHQVTVHLGGRLMLAGSPARVVDSNNVFGTDDPSAAARAMIDFVSNATGASLPQNLELYKLTRIDVTENYDLGSAAEVRQALSYLRHAEGGRYQLANRSETIYWGQRSKLRSGKAYHKGPHLRYQVRMAQAEATQEQQEAADRLLRLEVKFGREWMARNVAQWWALTPETLRAWHADYWKPLIGIEVIDMDKGIIHQIERVAPNKRVAMAVYGSWLRIAQLGVREAQAVTSVATWYRHRKILFEAGLSFADLHAGNVIPLRRKQIVIGAPVKSWGELKAA